MIYPDINLEEWLRRYPELEVFETPCLECNGIIQTIKPFISKDYIGLVAFKCPFCGVDHKAYASVPYSKSEIEEWNNFPQL